MPALGRGLQSEAQSIRLQFICERPPHDVGRRGRGQAVQRYVQIQVGRERVALSAGGDCVSKPLVVGAGSFVSQERRVNGC